MVLTGLIHDLGKMLAVFGEPQWAVVGDTYPLGCKFSEKIILNKFFSNNADITNKKFNTKYGIYKPEIGLDKVTMAWGHDEYLYRVIKEQSTLPEAAKFVIRFHSFYPLHKEGDYYYLLNQKDRKNLYWLKIFNKFDLYTKSNKILNIAELKPYYLQLINKYFPQEIIRW